MAFLSRRRRHEFHLVRAELRLHQPRLRARENLRCGARTRASLDQALQAGDPTDPATTMGSIISGGTIASWATSRPASRTARGWSAGGAGRAIQNRQGLVHRADHFCRCDHGYAHRPRGDIRARPSVFKWSDEDKMLAEVNQVEYGSPARSGPMTSPPPTAPPRRSRPATSGSTRCQHFSARRSAATNSPASAARNASRNCCASRARRTST